jgi:ribosomal protein S18 acetylase RimI-like enzyme
MEGYSTLSTQEEGFIVRGLRDRELERWAEHTAECFSSKPNAPTAQYFLNQYYEDPYGDLDASSIRVVIAASEAEASNPEFLASARLVLSNIRVKEEDIRAGGIADVCTKPGYQRKGLARLALLSCLELAEQCGCAVTMLHAAGRVQPLYRSFGSESMPGRWVNVPLRHLHDDRNAQDHVSPSQCMTAKLCVSYGGRTIDRPLLHLAPNSFITGPSSEQGLTARTCYRITGWAWGASDIVKVEISTNGGKSWWSSTVVPRKQSEWQAFEAEWTPESAGKVTLSCRATDMAGETQPESGARNAIFHMEVLIAQPEDETACDNEETFCKLDEERLSLVSTDDSLSSYSTASN